ncbi:MAG: dTDP-glucose 4,6-dehydratase [Deferribacteraceae bacterium]|jgi:dTDP-glucose 4,6-dehydratase|nr:dTDP-glucose 4,6-dehydratase [Deferribacteraceae bacterium]
MKTYFVTGGAGFIGSNYIHYMLKKYGKEITVINYDALTYAGNLGNLSAVSDSDNYTFIKGDVCDKNLLQMVFAENCIDYVIHFAAESHVDRSIKDPEIFVKTNVLGTAVLLNTAKDSWYSGGSFKEGKKYVQVSTDEVYGSLGETGFFAENTPLDARSPYSASKASADMLVKAYFDTFKMPVNITRCSNNYGPYQFPEKLIPLMINNALHGKNLPVYGLGLNVRDWLYVDDHARAVDIVTQKGKSGEVYNIGGHNEKKNIDIVNILIEKLSELLPDSDKRKKTLSKDLITYVEDRKGHDLRYAIDPQKIMNELGWKPETMFSEGIVKTIKWYLDNSEWLKNVTSGGYTKYYKQMYGGGVQE